MVVVRTILDLNTLAELAHAKDYYGLALLEQAGRVVTIAAGTEVDIEDTGGAHGYEVVTTGDGSKYYTTRALSLLAFITD